MLCRACLTTRTRRVLVPRRAYVNLNFDKELPPNWREQLKQKIVIHPPPSNSTDIIRETENVKELKEKFMRLTFVEMLALARELQKITTIPTEEQWKGVGLQMPRGLKGYTKTKQTAAPAEAAAEEAPKEKIILAADIKLLGYPEDKKIKLLKAYRQLKPGMALLESKKFVENLPQIIATGVTADELKDWKKELDELKCVYELVSK